MATRKKNAVVPAPSKQVVPSTWRERAAKSIVASKAMTAKLPQQSGNFLSFRSGQITLGGVPMQNPLPLVMLAHSYERAYYSKPYQPDATETPDCYSYDGVAPHEQSKVPQNDLCRTCRWNEFGSATNRKGKACREGARFAAIHADALKDASAIPSSKMIQGRLSVLNAMGFRDYVEYFEAANRPLWSGITTLAVAPDTKSMYSTVFTAAVIDGGDAVLNAVADRVDEAERMLAQPYPEFEDKPAPPPVSRNGKAARPRKFT